MDKPFRDGKRDGWMDGGEGLEREGQEADFTKKSW